MSARKDADKPLVRGAESTLDDAVERRSERLAVDNGARGDLTDSAPKSESAEQKAHHQPSTSSVWPIVLSLGLLLIAVGVLNTWLIAALGALVVLAALVGWFWQPWVA